MNRFTKWGFHRLKKNIISMNSFWFVICCQILLLILLLSTDSLILHSGWGLSRMMVWRGFAVTLGWNTFFLMLATIILKLRTWEALPEERCFRLGVWHGQKMIDTLNCQSEPLWASLSFNTPFTLKDPRTTSVKLRAFLNQIRERFNKLFQFLSSLPSSAIFCWQCDA